MQNKISIGDLCISTAGRDKGRVFLVVEVNGKIAFVVDGKVRKVTAPKKKNIKHLKSLDAKPQVGVALKIHDNVAVGNLTVKKAISDSVNIKQED